MTASENISEALLRRIREYREQIKVGSGVPHWKVYDVLKKLEELEDVVREAGLDVEELL